jgi:UDP-N-acetylglucosamine 2-epimerase (non-hydrolysing)/UDP-GlcNAc3NAcA epimerase
MYDSFLHFADQPWDKPNILDFDGNPVTVPSEYYYMTCHRQENTYSDEPLTEILLAMNSLDAPTIYAVHPRNHERAKRICEKNGFNNVILTQPVGYSDSVHLTKNAKKIVTDSGGLQCEAFYAGVQCVFVLDFVVWPETMVDNRNQLAKADHKVILEKLAKQQTIDPSYQPFGNGHAAEEICRIITEWERKKN